jgi:sodium transport system permease protein
MKSAMIVFLKEVRENLRDRRTVINTLLTGPLFAPLVFVIIINTAVTREIEKAEKALPVPVVGAERAPNLIAELKQRAVEIKAAPAPDKSGNRINEFSMNISIKRAKAEESATSAKGAPAKPAGAAK